MHTTKHFIAMLLCALLSAPATLAQNPQRNGQTDNAVSQDVLIIIQQQQVRFTAQRAVEWMQLQVFNPSGEPVFDSSPVAAGEINWPLQNGNGETLKSGLYAYTLSIKEAGAETARMRRGHFIVDRTQDRDGTDKLWVTSQNASGVGTELTVARDENTTVAGGTISSERTVGQRSELSTRDGSDRKIEAQDQSQPAHKESVAAVAAGTVGQIAKFTSTTDLGDSVMSEVNGSVGVGTATPTEKLTVQTTSGKYGITHTDGSVALSTWVGSSGGHSGGWFGTKSYDSLNFYTANGTARMTINPTGNVGIGTANPTSRLEIVGQDGLAITGYQPFLTLRDTNSGGLRSIIAGGNGDFGLYPNSFIGGYPAVLIKNGTGNVGIGTPNPTSKLEIVAQDGLAITGYQPFLTLRDTNAGGARSILAGGNGDFGFYPNSFIGASPAVLIKNSTGNVGIGTANPQAKLDVAGQTRTHSLQITGGADFAENFDVNVAETTEEAITTKVEAGMVVSIDPAHPGKLQLSAQAYDRRVAGIISGAGGVKPGMMMSQAGTLADGQHPVALSGRVYCWVDAAQAAIEPGDLLTTSATAGHAMKVTDSAKAQGAIIGKAMTGLKEGKGLVLLLVTLQ